MVSENGYIPTYPTEEVHVAITSSMFGRTILTGKDAEQMLKQMSNAKPNENAKRSFVVAH